MLIDRSEYDDLHSQGRELINNICIERRDQDHLLPGKAPGSTYSWMFYLRRALFNPDFSIAMTKMFLFRMAEERGKIPFQITGPESGAVPLISAITNVSAVTYGLNINCFSVRKDPKEYGLRNTLEGMIIPHLPVVLCDDLCNSSVSLRRCYDICNQHGIPIARQAFCIVNKVNKAIHKENRRHTDMYLPNGIEMIYLYDLDDFNLSNPSH